jgi:hypothetical protein
MSETYYNLKKVQDVKPPQRRHVIQMEIYN